MKKRTEEVKKIAGMAILGGFLMSCNPAPQTANDALSAGEKLVSCIIANLDKSPGDIALTCTVQETPDFVKIVQDLLGVRAAARARAIEEMKTGQIDAGAEKK